MVSTRSASSERQFGALREELALKRQVGGTVAGNLVGGRAPQHAQVYRNTLYRVSKRQIRAERSSVVDKPGEC